MYCQFSCNTQENYGQCNVQICAFLPWASMHNQNRFCRCREKKDQQCEKTHMNPLYRTHVLNN
jgi:hypothetical protein